MSEEQPQRSPFLTLIIIAALVAGGWYFFRHYEISGWDLVSIPGKQTDDSDVQFVDYHDDPIETSESTSFENPFAFLKRKKANAGPPSTSGQDAVRTARLRIASWPLDGFESQNLVDESVRENLVRIIRRFDLIALQQINARQRDLVPGIVKAVNAGNRRYDCLIGKPTGPSDRSTTLAFVFDKNRLLVDRAQTYAIADPQNQMTFDPLVAWFRPVQPDSQSAWTFSMVNVQIDLAQAADEVQLLSQIMSSVRFDGRGEDDVVLAGLFQADDAYLLPTMGGKDLQAAVRGTATDIFGKHQVSNLLVNGAATCEYVGNGGVFDFLRVFNLSIEEAEAVSTQLPVYAEFSVTEGEPF